MRNPQGRLLANLYASGKYAFGDREIADKVVSIAREALNDPSLIDNDTLRAECEPYDLLREFVAGDIDDPESSRLVLHSCIISTTAAYMARHGLFADAVGDVITAIAAHDRIAGEALTAILQAPIEAICAQPSMLERMVVALLGRESAGEEVWYLQKKATQSPIAVTAPQRISAAKHPAFSAIRSYEASIRQGQETKSASR